MNTLSLLAINLTRRCNLACDHCYLDADTLRAGSRDELTTKEVCQLLDEVASCGNGTMVVLTGGEPLARRDLETIAAHGRRLNLAMVVGTNGTLLTTQRVVSLQQAGVLGVGISLDSLDATYHDRFRGQPGCWSKTMTGIDNCRRMGLDFQIHFSVNDDNAHELAAMIDFSRNIGARVLNVFFLVCTGRGESMTNISPARYEQVLGQIIRAQQCVADLIIRPRCAPHFKRIAYQLDPDSPVNRISGKDADACIAGTHYCRVTPEGGVTACPYIEDEVGNIRQQSFTRLWQHSAAFDSLRHPVLQGKCGACEFQQLCGGCRARAQISGTGLMGEDPLCVFVPEQDRIIPPLEQTERNGIRWSPEARRRLGRIPLFLRQMVKKRAEAYVLGLGIREVTPGHLAELSARRFGRTTAARPGS